MNGYGWCPACGERAITRERSPNGKTGCVKGHKFPHGHTVNHEPSQAELDAYNLGGHMKAYPAAEPRLGALVFAVASHADAEALAPLVTAFPMADTDGVRVIPYAASALAYCGRSARLFRGLVIIPPRDGPIRRSDFDTWIRQAIAPFLAPNAPTVIL